MKPRSPIYRQRGAVLVVTLLILVVMTLIGAASMRTTTMEDRMAGNMRDRSLALQSAETALREAEQFIDGIVNISAFDGTGGLYGIDQEEPVSLFGATHWTDGGSQTYSGALRGVGSSPRFIIKVLRDARSTKSESLNIRGYEDTVRSGPVFFRISARGTGGSNGAQVVLRSHYGRIM